MSDFYQTGKLKSFLSEESSSNWTSYYMKSIHSTVIHGTCHHAHLIMNGCFNSRIWKMMSECRHIKRGCITQCMTLRGRPNLTLLPFIRLNIQLRTQLIWSFFRLHWFKLNRMNQNKTKKEENKKTLWSQSNKTYVRSHGGWNFLSHAASDKRIDRQTFRERKWFSTDNYFLELNIFREKYP